MRCELRIKVGKPERCGKPALFLWLAIVRKYAICADCAGNPYIDARDLELLPEVVPDPNQAASGDVAIASGWDGQVSGGAQR
jgi:hypothetical protein